MKKYVCFLQILVSGVEGEIDLDDLQNSVVYHFVKSQEDTRSILVTLY